ncbi:MAG: T9SS type A sorting domain-containing protein [Bacteroidota bacterium]|jgi:hypothetical protein
MKKTLTNFLLIAFIMFKANAQDTTGNRIVSITTYPCTINFFTDTVADFTSVDIDSISYNGSSAGFAIFTHPATHKLYILADSINNGNNRDIYELNPLTGERTFVMATGNFFSSLEITDSGRVFGIVGQNAQPPMNKGEVYEFNLVNKTKTLVLTIPISSTSTKTSLGFNPVDQLLYAFSTDFSNSVDTLTKINISNFSFTRSAGNWSNYEIDGAFFYAPDTFMLANYGYTNYFYKISSDTIVKQKTGLNYHQMDLARIKLINSEESRSLCSGETINLHVMFHGANFQWYKNGVAVSGATLDSLTVNTSGTYKVLAEIKPNKFIWSEEIVVSQLNSPTVNISSPQGLAFCANSSITLTGTSGGSSQWYQNGSPISGATTNTLTVTTAGVYNMIKTNTNGCSDSASTGAVVIVYSLPIVALASQPNYCPTQSQIALSGGAPAGGNYSGIGVINNSDFNPSVSGPGSYLITYSYTDTNNCTGSASDTLVVDVCASIGSEKALTYTSVFPNPFQSSITISSGNSSGRFVILNAIGQEVYSGFIPNEKNINLEYLPTGVYSVRFESKNGIEFLRLIKN